MRVLVVDDDPQIRSLLERALRLEGFDPVPVTTAEEALDRVDDEAEFGLFVVDQMLPGMSGLALVKALRQQEASGRILMLTAKDAVADRVLGLEAGADDYLGKPFAVEELVARLRALVRRDGDPQPVLRFADVAFDTASLEAERAGRALDLTPTERKLLAYLLRHPRQALSRAQILEAIWGYDFGGEDNVLEVYIGYLRKKLEAEGGDRLIHTVRGHGYALREP